MQMYRTGVITVQEIKGWSDRGDLDLTPNFQRRAVWSDKARAYLIDTILRGKPIPTLYIRQQDNPSTGRTVYQVVDGQQRLKSVLDFIDDGFAIDPVHYPELGDQYYTELDDDVREALDEYKFAVNFLMDAPDAEVYDIFARLNRYPVRINAQEYRNSQFFGEFKTTVYKLALEYNSFWLQNGIFSDKQIARMLEAEFTADLLIAMSSGIKERSKAVIDKAFKDNDANFPKRLVLMRQFREVMDMINNVMKDSLRESSLKRIPLLYSLFCAFYHLQFGLPELKVARIKMRNATFPRIRVALERVDQVFELPKSKLTAGEKRFREATEIHTIRASNRRTTVRFLLRLIGQALEAR